MWCEFTCFKVNRSVSRSARAFVGISGVPFSLKKGKLWISKYTSEFLCHPTWWFNFHDPMQEPKCSRNKQHGYICAFMQIYLIQFSVNLWLDHPSFYEKKYVPDNASAFFHFPPPVWKKVITAKCKISTL